ncbi:TPA: glycosyltransferase family 4 protein [Vibrio parahaemolyticus]|uniref:Glycosyl transferase group 1 n=1 Tax=Vibrio parahaemolyticus TaxID=670 RepID=A0A5P4SC77_VIBPH|nr:glycosyltransferase family 4 protein [Vibrio parahaemolyticus]EHU5174108.1 glycosyltransferase family 4 protein [Vibrio parahaemolyticus]EHV5545552.1 glycosyltransferase family 4 protein [Vibrio parahaemolyticus]EJG1031341.1 glycosyltransferase family 4 protein [Vibrio parahaemolyticus]MRD95310.1 glycosyltransferase [Vibrio parahaemolyticus]ODX72305.1 hypothetical protein BBM10_15415 [Vibrio parahaemolyticus]
MNKRIIYFGNIFNNSGPSIVNRNLYAELSDSVFFFEDKSWLGKLRTLYKVLYSDVVVLSGLGILNFLGLIVGFLSRKKIVYLMHGAIKIEEEFRNYSLASRMFEYFSLMIASKIYCVSKSYKLLVINKLCYRKYANKIVIIPLGFQSEVAPNEILNGSGEADKEKLVIVTVGGGRREKNILSLCRVLSSLDLNIELRVIGPDGLDTNEIKKFDFVNYLGTVHHTELMGLFSTSNLYIQYSLVDSFGLAPLEAVQQGCNLLVTKEVGLSDFLPSSAIVDGGDRADLQKKLYIRNSREVLLHINNVLDDWSEVADKYYKSWVSL